MYISPTMKQSVLLKGAQGLELLHRISSLDVLGLEPGSKRKGLILNPAGKILSFFEIEKLDATRALIDFEPGFLEHLDHYTFAERYELEPLAPPPPIAEPLLDRILALRPEVGFEFHLNGETNPLEVNLQSAISDQKGCYPGQEVIEKTISLGSPAKKLALIKALHLVTELNTPAKIFSSDQHEVGVLTSYASGYGLAILKRTHLKPSTPLLIENQEFIVERVSS